MDMETDMPVPVPTMMPGPVPAPVVVDAGLAALNELRGKSLGSGVWVAIGLYLAALLACCFVPFIRRRGWVRAEAEEENTMISRHFIAGGSLGLFVMPLTLFATLFSGIALVGIPSEASQVGFYTLRWVFSLVPVGIGYMALGPRMRRWSDYRGGYMTGCDPVSDRFRCSEMRTTIAIVQIFAAFLYVLAQFVAIGATLFALSNGQISRVAGASALAVIMFIYEAVGGMQSVAWTDVIQGIVLLIGFLFVYIIQKTEFGGVPHAVEVLSSIPVEAIQAMVAVPTLERMGLYLPFLFSFLPFVLYGHMQQRIYAASSEKTFKSALVLLTLISLFITVGSTFTGIVGRAYFIENFGVANAFSFNPDETFGLVMRILMVGGDNPSETSGNYIMGSLILAASVAALMSTADSALLSMSSVVCLDIIQPFSPQEVSPRTLVWIGRATSFVVSVAGVAISSTEPDLVDLLLTQQQFLMQLLPPFIAALYFKKARVRPMTIGLVAGLIVNLIMVFGMFGDNPRGAAGTAALMINVFLAVVLHYVDHPWLNHGTTGKPHAWERFGEPLPEDMVGLKVPGFASELIHAPWWYGWATIVFVSFLLAIPWFHTPGTINLIGNGLPGWAVQQIVVFAIFSVSLGLLTYYGWGIGSKYRGKEAALESEDSVSGITSKDGGKATADSSSRTDSLDEEEEIEMTADPGNDSV